MSAEKLIIILVSVAFLSLCGDASRQAKEAAQVIQQLEGDLAREVTYRTIAEDKLRQCATDRAALASDALPDKLERFFNSLEAAP